MFGSGCLGVAVYKIIHMYNMYLYIIQRERERECGNLLRLFMLEYTSTWVLEFGEPFTVRRFAISHSGVFFL